jgi:hypothetical protein
MKRALVLLGCLFIINAQAQNTYECFDRDLNLVAGVNFSAHTQVTGEWIDVQNGGLGTEPSITTHYREKFENNAELIFKGEPRVMLLNLVRYVWDGYPQYALSEGYYGGIYGKNNEYRLEAVAASNQEWGVPFQYEYVLMSKPLNEHSSVAFDHRYYCRKTQ